MAQLLQALNGKFWNSAKDQNPDCKGNKSRDSFLWNPYDSELGVFFEKKVKANVINAINKSLKKKGNSALDSELNGLKSALIESIKTNIKHEWGRIHPFMFTLTDSLFYYIANPQEVESLKKNIPFKASIEIAHKGCKVYDKEAYVYDDARLKAISVCLKDCVCLLWKNESLFLKCVDVFCFMMKEDIRWRRIIIKITQDIEPFLTRYMNIGTCTNPVLLTLFALCTVVRGMPLTSEEIENMRWDS